MEHIVYIRLAAEVGSTRLFVNVTHAHYKLQLCTCNNDYISYKYIIYIIHLATEGHSSYQLHTPSTNYNHAAASTMMHIIPTLQQKFTLPTCYTSPEQITTAHLHVQ